MTWLTATEALRVLGVRPQTLYANVSRKKIRAKPDPKDTRRSLYHEVDVRKLARQHGGRRKAAVVAAGAIEWGDPILPSAVSTVVAGHLYYRGKDAVVLSESASLEEVAALLWGSEAIDFDRAWRESTWSATSGSSTKAAPGAKPTPSAGPNEGAKLGAEAKSSARARLSAGVKLSVGAKLGADAKSSVGATLGAEANSSGEAKSSRATGDTPIPPSERPLRRAFLALGQRASTDVSTYGRSPSVLQAEAAGVLVTLVDSMLGSVSAGREPHGSVQNRSSTPRRSAEPIHDRIAISFGRRGAADIIRRALVLLADHELNASTFATRVAVSTGAPLSAGVLSGLATLSGPLHGRAALGVLELVAAVERVGAERAVRDRLSQGRPTAGFGHPLYPAGDPRAVALLGQFALPPEYASLRDVVEEVIGERPNVDFSLAALTKVHGLPPEAPLILFALGRCVGWLAHALEQVTAGQPIRPRARYVGPPIS